MSLRSFISLSILSILAAASIYAAPQKEPPSNPSDIRIVPVTPTPESETILTRIVFPQTKHIVTKNPVDTQLRLEGYPLRTYSQFPRAEEVMNYNREGQSLHIIVDDSPYFARNEAVINSLNNELNYYDQILEFDLPMDLKPGMHVLRIFPARSYGESLKGDGCMVSRVFYYKTTTPTMDVDLHQPYITPNQPQGKYKYDPKKPILLDFYVTNVQLSQDGYKVRVILDGGVQRTLYVWAPYYVYGLKPGSHTIKLELLNEKNKVVPGLFNSTERTFTLE